MTHDTHPRTRTFLAIFLVAVLAMVACRTISVGTTPTLTQEAQAAPSATAAAQAEPTDTQASSPTAMPIETQANPTTTTPGEPGPRLDFASYNEPQVQTGGGLPAYTIQPGLANVARTVLLSPEQVTMLEQNGFVVSPGTEKEFFTVYEKARYANVPIFITSDSLLHSYHLMFDKVLRTAEKTYFIPLLRELNASLLATADQQYQALQNTTWAEAALRSVAYFGVAAKLLDPGTQVPAYAADMADQEIALIEAASGMLSSPIFPYLDNGEDYTQYIPRSHYTLSEDLKAYFKSMMWYGRMTFRLKGTNPEGGVLETRMALLVVQALYNSQAGGKPAIQAWSDLYDPTAFFVGRSDDLTVVQYREVMEQVYGSDPALESLLDETRFGAFVNAALLLPPPRILGIVIMDTDDVEAATKGMRFMGQRFVPDAYIFRQLIYRNVGTREDPRPLPKGLDLLAAMGSQAAYQTLEDMGETHYENYVSQMEKMRGWTGGLSQADWTETLYNTWLYSFYPLLEVPGEGTPGFMQSPAWQYKQINTSLGSWTELKHDTLLYAKQVYAELGGGPMAPDPVPPRGYVEPVPLFFARLKALTEMTRTGLDQRGLLAEDDRGNLQTLEDMAGKLQTMAEKELRGEPLTDDEYEYIRYYGGELEHLVMASADSDITDAFAQRYMDEEPQAAVVADVATDPASKQVLEEAVGRIDEIQVVVPLIEQDGSLSLQVATGGVFAYYEFPWPMEDRLTDEKWRGMITDEKTPERPSWTGSYFIQQAAFSLLQQAVSSFQDSITNAYWDVGFIQFEPDDPLQAFSDQFEALRQAGQYIGHQLLRSEFTSFDLQSESKAVVVARETWQDALYQGEYPDFGVEPIGRRGPYSLQATYTLELVQTDWGANWQVRQVSVQGQPPDW